MNSQKKYTLGVKGFLLIILISMGSFSTTHAAVKNVTGQLKLLATIDNRPAFSSVIWKISNSKAGVQKFFKTIYQHAATVELAPGTYHVTLSAKNNKSQTHKVTIVERQQRTLTINLR